MKYKKLLNFNLFFVLCMSFLIAKDAASTLIDLESLNDSTVISTQYPGLFFSNGIVASSGLLLNEYQFPPSSGSNAVLDTGGPIIINFYQPVSSVSGRFTYNQQLSLIGYDSSNTQVVTVQSKYSKNTLGVTGSIPNELITLNYPNGLSYVKVLGNQNGGSFAMDDLSYTTVEPQPCNFDLAPNVQNVNSSGGSFTSTVTTDSSCNWKFQATDSWVSLTSNDAGHGNGVIQYIINKNTTNQYRTTSIGLWNGQTLVANIYINQSTEIPDTDADGIRDEIDNCKLLANPKQTDSDNDGFGNTCDADLNNDCKTNSLDLGKFKSVYGTNTGTPALKAAADFNGDGRVNSLDLGLFKKMFGKAPGPSGMASCP